MGKVTYFEKYFYTDKNTKKDDSQDKETTILDNEE